MHPDISPVAAARDLRPVHGPSCVFPHELAYHGLGDGAYHGRILGEPRRVVLGVEALVDFGRKRRHRRAKRYRPLALLTGTGLVDSGGTSRVLIGPGRIGVRGRLSSVRGIGLRLGYL